MIDPTFNTEASAPKIDFFYNVQLQAKLAYPVVIGKLKNGALGLMVRTTVA